MQHDRHRTCQFNIRLERALRKMVTQQWTSEWRLKGCCNCHLPERIDYAGSDEAVDTTEDLKEQHRHKDSAQACAPVDSVCATGQRTRTRTIMPMTRNSERTHATCRRKGWFANTSTAIGSNVSGKGHFPTGSQTQRYQERTTRQATLVKQAG